MNGSDLNKFIQPSQEAAPSTKFLKENENLSDDWYETLAFNIDNWYYLDDVNLQPTFFENSFLYILIFLPFTKTLTQCLNFLQSLNFLPDIVCLFKLALKMNLWLIYQLLVGTALFTLNRIPLLKELWFIF